MKSILIFTLLTFTFILLCATNQHVMAYDPPGPPAGHGGTGDEPPTGGSAPIAEGTSLFVVLAIGYGIKKWNKSGKK